MGNHALKSNQPQNVAQTKLVRGKKLKKHPENFLKSARLYRAGAGPLPAHILIVRSRAHHEFQMKNV
jgi:hypothetical protein